MALHHEYLEIRFVRTSSCSTKWKRSPKVRFLSQPAIIQEMIQGIFDGTVWTQEPFASQKVSVRIRRRPAEQGEQEVEEREAEIPLQDNRPVV